MPVMDQGRGTRPRSSSRALASMAPHLWTAHVLKIAFAIPLIYSERFRADTTPYDPLHLLMWNVFIRI